LAVNLVEFRNCLAEYTVRSLSTSYELLTVLVLMNIAARWFNTAQFFKKVCNFTYLCAWASEGIFPRGPLVYFPTVFLGYQKWCNLFFTTRN